MLGRWLRNKPDDDKSGNNKPSNSKSGHNKPGQNNAAATDGAAATPSAPNGHAAWLADVTHGQAIDSITDPDLLHLLLKNSDKLDKRSNRTVRDKLAQLRDQDKQQQQHRAQQERLCVRLETLGRLQYHPLYDSEFLHLEHQWRSLAPHDADLAARVAHASAQCQHTVTAAQQAKAEVAAAQADATQAEQAQHAAQTAAAEARRAADAQRAQAEAERTAKRAEDKEKQAARQQQQQAAANKVTQQLDAAEAALEQADGKKARQAIDRAINALASLDKGLAHRAEGRLHLLQGRLRELQDWQSFAALPKLEQLCVDMEALANTPLPVALEQAAAVHALQEQWRSIKLPAGKSSQALWDRFHKADKTAWLPCAAHYDHEKQQRQFNLQQREAICEALEQFHAGQNWDKADWKAVARILEKAKQEFHQFHPVERGSEKAVRKRFDHALEPVQSKLHAEQLRNEERKLQLVNTAAALENMANVEQASERVRQLQTQWKDIGTTRRHEDQKLWQQFQRHCHAVFNKRQASRDASRSQEQGRINEARALCDAIAALAKLPDAELGRSQAEFERLQTAFRAITDLPEKLQLALKKQFHTACDRYRDAQAGIGQRQRTQQWQVLAECAALCHAIETETAPDAREALCTQWEAACSNAPLPGEWHKAMQSRWQAALAHHAGTHTTDHASNETRRRELLIELDLLLDRETPEPDKALRRELQMRKLQQGLGQAVGSPRERQEALLLQWYTALPAAPTVQTALQTRFTQLGIPGHS